MGHILNPKSAKSRHLPDLRRRKKARMLPVKCASSDSYVPPPMGAVGDTFEDRGRLQNKTDTLDQTNILPFE